MKLRYYLTELLTPGDDGRAFAAAVLLRASGALHRRRRAAEAPASAPAWAWLERWARPWVVALLVVLSVVIAIPALPRVASRGLADSGVDALVSSTTPDVVLAASSGN